MSNLKADIKNQIELHKSTLEKDEMKLKDSENLTGTEILDLNYAKAQSEYCIKLLESLSGG